MAVDWKPMKTLFLWVSAGAIAMSATGCLQQRTGVTQNEVPGPVLATMEKSARPGKIKTIIRETSEKQVVYKAQVTSEGHAWEVAVDGSGELLYKKEK